MYHVTVKWISCHDIITADRKIALIISLRWHLSAGEISVAAHFLLTVGVSEAGKIGKRKAPERLSRGRIVAA